DDEVAQHGARVAPVVGDRFFDSRGPAQIDYVVELVQLSVTLEQGELPDSHRSKDREPAATRAVLVHRPVLHFRPIVVDGMADGKPPSPGSVDLVAFDSLAFVHHPFQLWFGVAENSPKSVLYSSPLEQLSLEWGWESVGTRRPNDLLHISLKLRCSRTRYVYSHSEGTRCILLCF